MGTTLIFIEAKAPSPGEYSGIAQCLAYQDKLFCQHQLAYLLTLVCCGKAGN